MAGSKARTWIALVATGLAVLLIWLCFRDDVHESRLRAASQPSLQDPGPPAPVTPAASAPASRPESRITSVPFAERKTFHDLHIQVVDPSDTPVAGVAIALAVQTRDGFHPLALARTEGPQGIGTFREFERSLLPPRRSDGTERRFAAV